MKSGCTSYDVNCLLHSHSGSFWGPPVTKNCAWFRNQKSRWIRFPKRVSWNLDPSSILKSISDLDSKMPKIYLLQSESFPKLTNNGKVCFKVNSWQSRHSTRILLYKTWYINQDISGLKNVRSHFYVFFDVILRNCRFRQAILWNPGNKILNAEPSPKNWHICCFPMIFFF